MTGSRHRLGILADIENEDVGTAELEIDARLALRHAANDLGAEHALIKRGGRFRIAAEQVNVVEGELLHRASLVGSRLVSRARRLPLPPTNHPLPAPALQALQSLQT